MIVHTFICVPITPQIMPLVHTSLMNFISILFCNTHFNLNLSKTEILIFAFDFFFSHYPHLYRCDHNVPVLMSKRKKKRKEREGNWESLLVPPDSSFPVLQSSRHHVVPATTISFPNITVVS